MSKYTISFVAILAAFFFAYSAVADISASSNQKNDQYSNYLTTAAHDAAKEMKTSVEDGIAMPTDEDRQNVKDAFFTSLSKDFGYTSNEDLQRLHIYVPALLLVDSNGYYVCYNDVDAGKIRFAMTSLNTWTESFESGNYTFDIQYFLGHRVKITMGEKEDGDVTYTSYEGDFQDAAKKIKNYLKTKGLTDAGAAAAMKPLYNVGIRPAIEEASGIGAAEKSEVSEWNAGADSSDPTVSDVNTAVSNHFEAHRNELIIPIIEEKVNYYINKNNEAAASYQDITQNYTFTMPETSDNDWSRALKNPTVIGFLQGIRQSAGGEFLNIYAMSSGEISKANAATFTDSDNGRTYYASGEKSDGSETGYVPGNGAAAAAGDQDISRPSKTDRNDQTADGTYVHHHWGDPLLGTGCYGTPVYFQLKSSSYNITTHYHTDKNGQETRYTDGDGTVHEVLQVEKDKGPGGCYTIPVYHNHTSGCYKNIYHHHTGSSKTGGGCYTIPIYHTHTADCYSDGITTTYQPTKKIYHSHKDPVFYYAKEGDTSGKEYTEEEAVGDKNGDYYILRVDTTGDTCYRKITYSRSVLQVEDGTKTLIVEKTTDPSLNANLVRDEYTVVRPASYSVETGESKIERQLKAGDKISISYEDGKTIVTLNQQTIGNAVTKVKVRIYAEIETLPWSGTVSRDIASAEGMSVSFTNTDGVPAALSNAYYRYEGVTSASDEKEYRTETSGNGKNLVAAGFSYLEMEKTCGKDVTTIEDEVPDGDPIISTKKGELICGKDERTILYYSMGCGKIDISDTDSQEMKDYRDGILDSDYILDNSLEETRIVCGYTEDQTTANIVGYKLSCNREDGETIYTVKPEEEAKVGTIDHYSLSCGLDDGEAVSKARYDLEQSQKAAAGY